MKFDWDEAKNEENIRKHGFDFSNAWKMFETPLVVFPDHRYDYGEQRSIGIGYIDDRMVLIAFSEPDDETTRIISMRKAKKHERAKFEARNKD